MTGAPTPLDYLNERHLPINNLSDATVCLCSHRRIADQINMTVTDQLPDRGIHLTGSVIGEFPTESLPTYRNMVIKVGMRVMLLANRIGRETPFDYVNGTMGRVVDYGNDYGKPFVTVRLDNDRHVTVNSHTWSNYSYTLYQDGSGNLELRQQEIGTFSQLPITPSYGITLHKSQGMTIDAPVCLMLDDRPCFTSGQIYVALTRCRRLDQIILNRPVSGLDCPMNEEVQWFYQDYNLE